MRRLSAFALLLASCHHPAPTRRTTVAPKPGVDTPPPAGEAPVHTVHQLRAAIEAPHAGAIVMLAGTPDGSAALSVDESGGARLWPTLDGTREPCVVEIPSAKRLQLAPRPGGFTATVLDESGGLYIAQLDDHGRTLSHTTLGIDPPFAGVATSSRGTIAWRTDQHVLRLDDAGKTTDDLPTQPQQQVVDIAVAGTTAVALVDNAGTREVRWLALEPRLKWGATIVGSLSTQTPIAVALAPDHKHLAVTFQGDDKGKSRRLTVFDDKGKALTAQDLESTTLDVAFADNTAIALGGGSGVTWLSVTSEARPSPGPSSFAPPSRQRDMLAAGGGHAIWPMNSELMIMTPTDTKFLGYETLSPRVAQPAPDGGMLAAMGTSFYLLDHDLHVSKRPTLGTPTSAQSTDLVWLGGNDWLLQMIGPGPQTTLSLVEIGDDKGTVVRDRLPEAHVIAYEPATDLVTLSFGSAPEVAKLDRKARSLTKLSAGPSSTGYEQTVFVPLDPKLARGMQLLAISLRDKVVVKWLADARALDKPSATLTLDGAYAAADAGGHVYAWRNNGAKAALTIYTDGTATGALPATGPGTFWPDHGGTRIVQLAASGVTMFDATGKTLWTRDLAGAQEAHWLTDGTLALVHATGIVKLDAATGAPQLARCGWGFGLSTKPHAVASRTEPICTMLDQ